MPNKCYEGRVFALPEDSPSTFSHLAGIENKIHTTSDPTTAVFNGSASVSLVAASVLSHYAKKHNIPPPPSGSAVSAVALPDFRRFQCTFRRIVRTARWRRADTATEVDAELHLSFVAAWTSRCYAFCCSDTEEKKEGGNRKVEVETLVVSFRMYQRPQGQGHAQVQQQAEEAEKNMDLCLDGFLVLSPSMGPSKNPRL